MRKIVFRFAGGPLDGKTVSGELAKHSEVRRYYALTHHGRVGQRFRTASEYAINLLTKEWRQEEPRRHFQQHHYQVADRVVNGKVMLVWIEYVTPDS